MALEITRGDKDPEPHIMEDYLHRTDWPKWKEAMQVELSLFDKQEVFGPVVFTPEDVNLVGCKRVFVQKLNE